MCLAECTGVTAPHAAKPWRAAGCVRPANFCVGPAAASSNLPPRFQTSLVGAKFQIQNDSITKLGKDLGMEIIEDFEEKPNLVESRIHFIKTL